MSKNISKKKNIIYTTLFVLIVILLLIIRFPKTVDTIKLDYNSENLNFVVQENVQTTNDLKISYDQGKGYSYYNKTKKIDVFNDMLPKSATNETALFEVYERGNKQYTTNLNTINIGLKKLKLTIPNIDGNFELSKISFFNGAKEVASISAKDLQGIVTPTNTKMELDGDILKFTDIKQDAYIEINTSFNSIYHKELSHFGIPNVFLILIVVIIYFFVCHRNKLYKIFEDIK